MTSWEVEKLQERLLALGAIEILSGVIILVLGVFLGSLQGIFDFFGEFSFFTFYSGYTIWGPVCVDVNFWRYLISAVIALLGAILLSANLALNNVWLAYCPLSESPDLCLYMGTSNNGLMSIMLIFTLLELCMTISMTIKKLTAFLVYWRDLVFAF